MGEIVDFEIGKPHGFNGDGYSTPEQKIAALPEPDPVKSPSHYNRNGIETWDLIEHIVRGYTDPIAAYHVASMIKYMDRAPFKGNPGQDLRKAIEHAKRLEKHLNTD